MTQSRNYLKPHLFIYIYVTLTSEMNYHKLLELFIQIVNLLEIEFNISNSIDFAILYI